MRLPPLRWLQLLSNRQKTSQSKPLGQILVVLQSQDKLGIWHPGPCGCVVSPQFAPCSSMLGADRNPGASECATLVLPGKICLSLTQKPSSAAKNKTKSGCFAESLDFSKLRTNNSEPDYYKADWLQLCRFCVLCACVENGFSDPTSELL